MPDRKGEEGEVKQERYDNDEGLINYKIAIMVLEDLLNTFEKSMAITTSGEEY